MTDRIRTLTLVWTRTVGAEVGTRIERKPLTKTLSYEGLLDAAELIWTQEPRDGWRVAAIRASS